MARASIRNTTGGEIEIFSHLRLNQGRLLIRIKRTTAPMSSIYDINERGGSYVSMTFCGWCTRLLLSPKKTDQRRQSGMKKGEIAMPGRNHVHREVLIREQPTVVCY